ncbi:MAG: hypothetical protein R3F41_18640 [Gammaproteobacteria bacterium]|nr:hypothetical protein [Pseudomonadales bacterium]MCP5347570.1 hypothetical protein [Pseudomonadales bacterium]
MSRSRLRKNWNQPGQPGQPGQLDQLDQVDQVDQVERNILLDPAGQKRQSGTGKLRQSTSRTRIYARKDRTFYVFQDRRPGSACFFDDDCYLFFLSRLYGSIRAFRLQLHTYSLLPGEMHLLVTAYSEAGLLRLLKCVNSSYADCFSNRFERHRLSPTSLPVCRRLTGGNLVLDCQKYIELAPLRARLAQQPGEYPWSGYTVNAFGGHGIGLVGHFQYRKLCSGSRQPFQRYRDFIATPFTVAQQQFLERRLRFGFPLTEYPVAATRHDSPTPRLATS